LSSLGPLLRQGIESYYPAKAVPLRWATPYKLRYIPH
jgi:hypothetical protein